MKYDCVIWDFNGTLLDDVDLCLDCLNTLLKKYGKKTCTLERYRDIFDFPIENYYTEAGFDFEQCPYNKLAEEWTALYHRDKKFRLYDGTIGTLTEIKKAGLPQYIISASEKNALAYQTKLTGIDGFFEKMLSRDDIKGGSKLGIAKEWAMSVDYKNPVLIGDTTHDAQTAMHIGADCFLIAAGHQSRSRLEQTGFTVCENISKIPELILKSTTNI